MRQNILITGFVASLFCFSAATAQTTGSATGPIPARPAIKKTLPQTVKGEQAPMMPATPKPVITTNPSRNPLYAQPPVLPKKVVMDTVKNELYWPQSLPFWIRLATSSRDHGESFLLNKVSSSSAKSTADYGGSGIHLEVNGRQTLRWYNYVTRDTVLLNPSLPKKMKK